MRCYKNVHFTHSLTYYYYAASPGQRALITIPTLTRYIWYIVYKITVKD